MTENQQGTLDGHTREALVPVTVQPREKTPDLQTGCQSWQHITLLGLIFVPN